MGETFVLYFDTESVKKCILYDSNTGNTRAMAEAIFDGAKESGAEVSISKVTEADIDAALSCDVLYLGCPAMSVEMVGDGQTDFMAEVRMRFQGKKVAIFGSCAHGEGIWLRGWSSKLKAYGATVVNWPGLMCKGHPDEESLERCRALGADEFL